MALILAWLFFFGVSYRTCASCLYSAILLVFKERGNVDVDVWFGCGGVYFEKWHVGVLSKGDFVECNDVFYHSGASFCCLEPLFSAAVLL